MRRAAGLAILARKEDAVSRQDSLVCAAKVTPARDTVTPCAHPPSPTHTVLSTAAVQFVT